MKLLFRLQIAVYYGGSHGDMYCAGACPYLNWHPKGVNMNAECGLIQRGLIYHDSWIAICTTFKPKYKKL